MSNQITLREEVRNNLQRMGPEFKKALPSHIPVDRFIRVVQTAITNNPSLLNVDRTSLYAACVKSAEAGLIPNGSEAALVPFKGKAVFMPMVGGILKLVRNSGELSSITSQVVYENDKFKYFINNSGEILDFEPNMFSDRGEPIGVFALAKTKDGAVYIEILTKDDVSKIKASSSSPNGPWSGQFYLEMWRKSAIRRLAKRLPKSTDLESVLEADNELYMPPKEEIEKDVTPVAEEKQIENVAKKIKKKSKPKKLAELLEEQEAVQELDS